MNSSVASLTVDQNCSGCGGKHPEPHLRPVNIPESLKQAWFAHFGRDIESLGTPCFKIVHLLLGLGLEHLPTGADVTGIIHAAFKELQSAGLKLTNPRHSPEVKRHLEALRPTLLAAAS